MLSFVITFCFLCEEIKIIFFSGKLYDLEDVSQEVFSTKINQSTVYQATMIADYWFLFREHPLVLIVLKLHAKGKPN